LPEPAPEPEAEPAEPADEPPVEGEPVTEPQEPKEEPKPVEPPKPETITIELDPTQPYAQGQKTITVSTPHEERIIKGLINGYERKSEVAELRQELARERTRRIELQRKDVHREAYTAVTDEFRATPQYKAAYEKYQEIKESLGPEEAETYWQGFEARLQPQVESKFKENWQQVEQQDQAEWLSRWKDQAWQRAQQGYPGLMPLLPQFGEYFTKAVRAFGAEIEAELHPDLDMNDPDLGSKMQEKFAKFFSRFLIGQEAAVGAMRKIREEREQKKQSAATTAADEERKLEAIKRQAVEEYKKLAAQKRQETPPHPLGNLPGAPRERVSQGSEPGAPESPEYQSPHELRKAGKRAAREAGRRTAHQLGAQP
jgi:hypothetical protein